MKRAFAVALSTVLVAGSVSLAGEVKSGLDVGERVPAYYVVDVTGPSAGKPALCYRCQFGQKPVVNIFTRELDDNTVKLIKKIDAELAANKSLKAFVVLISEDADQAASKLKEVASKEGIKNVPLTVFKGSEGPEGYNISKDADVTVLMWNESTVKANHAFKAGELKSADVKRVVKDVEKIKS